MSITTKGQITIPKDVRDALGLQPGDDLVFFAEKGKLIGHPVRRRSISELAGSMKSDVPYRGREAEREAIAQYFVERNRRKMSGLPHAEDDPG